MNKKQGLSIGIAMVLLFTGIALATSTNLSASSDIIIYAFDQNPAGSDKGNEWVTLYNPSNESVDIGNWTLETADGERETISEGTTLYPFAYYVYSPPYQWLDNTDEAITLSDSKGEVVDRTPVVSDSEGDNRYWMRNDSEWIFGVKKLEKGKIWSGYVKNVVDGDTIDVSFGITGIQRIRLVGVNTPEIGEREYEEAKEFVNKTCLGEVVTLDVDDKKQYDPYFRILAVVYVNDTNLNEKLVREGYAEIMYIPPSEFNPYEWKADCTPTPIPTLSSTSTPMLDFDFLFAIIGILAAIYLIKRRE
jgi:micrococcal nuclease